MLTTLISAAPPISSPVAPSAMTRPASRRTTQSASRRACARSWVTRTTRSRAARGARAGSPRPRRGLRVERRGRLVEEQDAGLERERPGEHRPLLLADREPRASRLGEGAVEPGELEQPLDIRLAAGELGAEADVVGDGALEQRRQLRHQADLAAQLEHVALADVGAAVEDHPGVRVGEPVEQPQERRLARAGGSGDAARPVRQGGGEAVQDLFPAALEADLGEARTAWSG